MLAILIFSWIVSVLFVVLAERNNGYSSSLNYKQREERLKEEGRRLDRKRAALKAKHKEEHRIWMELMGFAKEEEKKKLIKTNYNIVFFMARTQTFETILTPDFAVSNISRIFAV